MSMRADWVDELFDRLTVRYGAVFMRQYADIDANAVKADWADVLDGFSGGDIKHALAHLPADRPPTAMQFRDLCRRAPVAAPLAIEAPKADPARVAAAIAAIGKGTPDLTMGERCYENIQARVRESGHTSPAQRHHIDAMREAGLLERYGLRRMLDEIEAVTKA